MNANRYAELLSGAAAPGDPVTLALAGVLSGVWQREPPRCAPDMLRAMLARMFPGVPAEHVLPCHYDSRACHAFRVDEYDDLLALLLAHRSHAGERADWAAHAIAAACLGGNHLWQDMGLPDRAALSELLRQEFTSLHDRNRANMKWKKFFYKQLCERAEVMACKAPSCAACCDFSLCFGPE